MQRVEGKAALITGGRRGLGKAAAILLAKEGARIVITDRKSAPMPEGSYQHPIRARQLRKQGNGGGPGQPDCATPRHEIFKSEERPMMMNKTLAIAAMLLALAVPAAAQNQDAEQPEAPTMQEPGMMGCPMHGQPMRGGMMMGQGMMCPMMMHGKPRTEGYLAFLKVELKITAGQENAWKAYAATLRDIHQAMADRMGQMRRQGMGRRMMQEGERKSVPEALQARIGMMESMLANLKKLQAATAKLYGVLDDAQKATADELLGMPCGMAMEQR